MYPPWLQCQRSTHRRTGGIDEFLGAGRPRGAKYDHAGRELVVACFARIQVLRVGLVRYYVHSPAVGRLSTVSYTIVFVIGEWCA